MSIELGVAESSLPGTVMTPNANDQSFEPPNELAQFGQQMEKPVPDAVQSSVSPEDQKRFEYHQSRADKAEAKAMALEAQLIAKSKNDPLIDLIQKDEVSYQFLQNRLSGNRTPDKPLEPPQKPNSYNEVEAFSNPESASFKYRNELESYKDNLLQSVVKQNAAILQQREQEKAMIEQQRAHQEGLRKFRDDVISKGISDTEFAEFFELVNKATPDDMVEFFKFKKAQSSTTTGMPRFDVPLTSSVGNNRSGKTDPLNGLVELSRRM